MDIQSAIPSASPSSGGKAGKSDSVEGMNDQFLQLMVAQIKNQDPLNPTDGTKFVSQLAQLSSVEGIRNIGSLQEQNNIKLDTLEVLQSADLAGKRVTVPASEVSLSQDQDLQGQVNLKESVSDLVVVARNSDGEIVEKRNLGRQTPGPIDFEMQDLEAGHYQIEAASGSADNIINHSTSLTRVVDMVSPDQQSGRVQLTINGVGDVAMTDIQQFLGE